MKLNLLAFMNFLKTPAGTAVFTVAAVVLLILILDLNYRIFTKYLLDFLAAFVTVIVLSPVLAVCAVVSKMRSENGAVFDKTAAVGAKGRVISVTGFAGIDGCLKNLPRILDVLCGKLSIVGPSVMAASDAALIDDEASERFSVRAGIISPLAIGGNAELTYEEVFAADVRYVKKREMFMDFAILINAAVKGIRGDGRKYLGEAADNTYAQVLIKRGTITEEQAATARSYAEEASRNQ